MKKWIVVILMSVFANTAYAAVDYITVCDQLDIPFSSDRQECYNAVRGAEFVQDGAIRVCKSAQFSDDKVSCIINSLNKTYLESEIRVCAVVPFSDEKAECMKERGALITNTICSDDGLKQQLRRVKRSISRGDYFRALLLLDGVLNNLD